MPPDDPIERMLQRMERDLAHWKKYGCCPKRVKPMSDDRQLAELNYQELWEQQSYEDASNVRNARIPFVVDHEGALPEPKEPPF